MSAPTALRQLERWAAADAPSLVEAREAEVVAVEEEHERAAGEQHRHLCRIARRHLGGIAPQRADHPPSWLSVGTLLRAVSPQLLGAWVKWTQQAPRWQGLRLEGFEERELREMCELQWEAFEAPFSPPHVALQELARLSKADCRA